MYSRFDINIQIDGRIEEYFQFTYISVLMSGEVIGE